MPVCEWSHMCRSGWTDTVEGLRLIEAETKNACLGIFSSGILMQNKPVNPIDTAPKSWTEDFELANPQRTLTICSCVKNKVIKRK